MKIVLLEGRANFLMKLLRCQFVPSEPDREPFSELINQLFLFKEPEKPVFGKMEYYWLIESKTHTPVIVLHGHQKRFVPKFKLANHQRFDYQQGKISEKWPNFVDLIWPQVNRPNFMNLERISSGERIAAEFSVPNSIFVLPTTGTTWVRIGASSLFAKHFVGQSTHLQPVFQCLQFNISHQFLFWMITLGPLHIVTVQGSAKLIV